MTRPRISFSWRFLWLSLQLIVSCHAFFTALPTGTTRHTTRPATLLSSSSDNNNDDNSDFMKSLNSRMAQVQEGDTRLPIVVLDSMLPRQVLKIEVENDIFQSLVKHCIERERPRFGMIGVATLASNGQTWPLQNGVEVELVEPVQVVEGQQGETSDGTTGKALRVKLVAGRRFRINQGDLQTNPAGWTEAKVEFLDNDDADEKDALSSAQAKKLAAQLTADDNNLVEQWIKLARTKEHFAGQIDQLLEDLGDIPPADQPTDRAFWVGALINPLPGMGVAMELRPQLLMAKTAEERIGTVYSGIEASISHMDGSKPLF